MNIIDLFSGAGGLTEGFRNLNFDVKVHVEMDSAACETLTLRDAFYYLKSTDQLELYRSFLLGEISKQVLLKAVPDDVLNKTINGEINSENILSIFKRIDDRLLNNNLIDGIIGGPPCQAYSTVGRAVNKQKKDTDKRIYLYKYYIDFLTKYKPKFFIFENVKGLLSFKDQFNELLLPKMIEEFAQSGYRVSYKLVDSSKFGVPQKRERLIIFGTNDQINPDLFFEQLMDNEQEVPVTVGQLFQDLPKMTNGQENNKYGVSKPCYFVSRYIRPLNSRMPLTQNIARPNISNDLKIYKEVAIAKRKGINLKYTDISSGRQTHKNKHSFLDRYKALDEQSISHTLIAHIAKDGHYYIHPDVSQNRSITLREAARIQTFPDDFYFEHSRTQAFKQIGNAVPPVLSKKFAHVITRLYTSQYK